MRRVILVGAAVVAAAAAWIAVSLPPARLVLAPLEADPALVAGVFHVHTSRSDGRSTPEEIAADAARAGLRFVIFTDHGDATREPARPVYHAGVLCIDGVEVSTRGGHYAAIDLPKAPYPLGGEARDVIEDVRRLGGFGIAAHPDSPKDELSWRAWDEPFDGLEVMNLDSGWRTEVRDSGWLSILGGLATYPFRPAETIGTLFGESRSGFARWDSLTQRRRVVALGAVDAHAKLALRDVEPGDNRFTLPMPSYQAAFGALTMHVRADRPLSGDAEADAALLVAAIRAGRHYTAMSALAAPALLEFTATSPQGSAHAGGEIAAGGPVTLRVRSNAPPGFVTTVYRDGAALSGNRTEQDFTVEAPPGPGVYRVEVRAAVRDGSPLWIVSNPIYVRAAVAPGAPPARPRTTETRMLFDGRDSSAWSIETNATSLAAFDVRRGLTAPELGLRFGLATGEPADQFAALGVATPGGLAPFERLAFVARAERPMRLSVQLRAPVTPQYQERWERSVYLDEQDREIAVPFDEVVPIGSTRTGPVPLAAVRSVVFAVETTHTRPGTSGRVWLRAVRVER